METTEYASLKLEELELELTREMEQITLHQTRAKAILARLERSRRTARWVEKHTELVAKTLNERMLAPWFVLPVLHALRELASNHKFDADPTKWFADQSGMLIAEANRLAQTAQFYYKPSAFPIRQDEAALPVAQRTRMQQLRQTDLKHQLEAAGMSTRGMEIAAREIQFLSPEQQHLGPQIVTEVLQTMPDQPSVTEFRRRLSERVDEANRVRAARPGQRLETLKFSDINEHGMQHIYISCFADKARTLRTFLDRQLAADAAGIDRRMPRVNQHFQALYRHVYRSLAGPELPQPASARGASPATASTQPRGSGLDLSPRINKQIGVVLSLQEFLDASAHPEKPVRDSLGALTPWSQLQRGRMAPLDWIAYVGEAGLTLRRAPKDARFASDEQRFALNLITPYCVYPGCTKPTLDNEAHHVTPFHAGGATSADNIVSLCRKHHARNDDTRSRPGGFHAEIDENRVGYIIFHPTRAGEAPSPPVYNIHNLADSRVIRAIGGRKYKNVRTQRE